VGVWIVLVVVELGVRVHDDRLVQREIAIFYRDFSSLEGNDVSSLQSDVSSIQSRVEHADSVEGG